MKYTVLWSTNEILCKDLFFLYLVISYWYDYIQFYKSMCTHSCWIHIYTVQHRTLMWHEIWNKIDIMDNIHIISKLLHPFNMYYLLSISANILGIIFNWISIVPLACKKYRMFSATIKFVQLCYEILHIYMMQLFL